MLEKLDGVQSVEVEPALWKAVVQYDPAKVTPQQIVAAVKKLGYRVLSSSKLTGSMSAS
jgi:copper chaperone CopZ